MKILYVGQLSPNDSALYRLWALERLGHTVVAIDCLEYQPRECVAAEGGASGAGGALGGAAESGYSGGGGAGDGRRFSGRISCWGLRRRRWIG